MKGDRIQYRAGYKYSLWEPYRVQLALLGHTVTHHLFDLTPDGWLTIHADYPWDGPSGPTIDTPNFMRGSLVHDVLYEMMRLGLLPADCFHAANEELRRICREDGMSDWRSNYVFTAVERFGTPSAAVKPEPVIMAP